MRNRVFSWGLALVAGVVLAAVFTGVRSSGTATAASSAAGGTVPSGIVIICAQDTSGDTNDTCTVTAGGGDGSTSGDGATVGDPAVPTGVVNFALDAGATGSLSSASCTLAPSSTSDSDQTSECAVTYTPGVTDGTPIPITAVYPGDAYFAPTNGTPTAAMGANNYAVAGWTPASGTEGGYSGTSTLPAFDLTGLATGGDDSITTMDMTTGVYSGTADVSGTQFADNGVENGDFTVLQLTEGGYVSTNALQYHLLADGDVSGAARWYGGTYVGDYPNPPGRVAVTEGVTCTPAGSTSYTCTETVSGASGVPTGNATFSGLAGGTFSPSTACALNNGSCAVTYTPPAGAGVSGLSAVYSGSPGYDWTQATATGPGLSSTTTGTTTSTTTTTTTTTTTAKVPSATKVTCDQEIPESQEAGEPGIAYLACTAIVSGTNGSGVRPTGSVKFTADTTPASVAIASPICALKPSTSGATAYCTVTVLPSQNPIPTAYEPPITATYSGDTNFAVSSGKPVLGPGPVVDPEDPDGQDNPSDPGDEAPTIDEDTVNVDVDPSAAGESSVTVSGGGSDTDDTDSYDSGSDVGEAIVRRDAGPAAAVTSHWVVCKRSGAKLICSLGTLAAHDKVTFHLVLGFTPAAAGQTKKLTILATQTPKHGKAKTLAKKIITVKVPKRTVLGVTLTAPKQVGGTYTLKLKNSGSVAATKLRLCVSGSDGLKPVSAVGAKLSKGELCESITSLARGKALTKVVKISGSGILEAVISAGDARGVTVGI